MTSGTVELRSGEKEKGVEIQGIDTGMFGNIFFNGTFCLNLLREPLKDLAGKKLPRIPIGNSEGKALESHVGNYPRHAPDPEGDNSFFHGFVVSNTGVLSLLVTPRVLKSEGDLFLLAASQTPSDTSKERFFPRLSSGDWSGRVRA